MMQINKQAVAAAFNKAAQSYDQYDELQKRSAIGLLTLLKVRNFTTVLDAGCGPGSNSMFWKQSGSWVVALDLSSSMIAQARKKRAAHAYIIGDIEHLPIMRGKFDLVWSHLAIQWCNSLSLSLSRLYSAAHSDGKIAFTTLLSGSLYELNQAWYAIDKQPHVNNFSTKKSIETVLSLWNYHSNIQNITLYFKNAQSAMHSLKGIGATCLNHECSRKPITKRELYSLGEYWPKKDGYYPMTYRLFHGVIEHD